MAKVVEHLPSKSKALSSNPSSAKKRTVGLLCAVAHMPVIPVTSEAETQRQGILFQGQFRPKKQEKNKDKKHI
jgi:hypothetical protein